MVDYIDNDGDGRGDEMDIRYFVDGELRRSWFWRDHDNDGVMWNITAYEYPGNCFAADPYGDNVLFMNKYDPENKSWLPMTCRFASQR